MMKIDEYVLGLLALLFVYLILTSICELTPWILTRRRIKKHPSIYKYSKKNIARCGYVKNRSNNTLDSSYNDNVGDSVNSYIHLNMINNMQESDSNYVDCDCDCHDHDFVDCDSGCDDYDCDFD